MEGLKKMKYYPATKEFTSILFDTTDLEIFRANAYEALVFFNTDESKKVIKKFKKSIKTDKDQEVLRLGEYFINSENKK